MRAILWGQGIPNPCPARAKHRRQASPSYPARFRDARGAYRSTNRIDPRRSFILPPVHWSSEAAAKDEDTIENSKDGVRFSCSLSFGEVEVLRSRPVRVVMEEMGGLRSADYRKARKIRSLAAMTIPKCLHLCASFDAPPWEIVLGKALSRREWTQLAQGS